MEEYNNECKEGNEALNMENFMTQVGSLRIGRVLALMGSWKTLGMR